MKQLTMLTTVLSAFVIAHAATADKGTICIDLQPKANQKLTDNLHNEKFEGNNLAQLPKGESLFGDVKFKIEDKLIQLSSKYVQDKPDKVDGIQVGKKFAKLYLLHATGFGGFGKPGDPLYISDGTAIGHYTVKYEDNSVEIIPIVYGEDVRDWFDHDQSKPVQRGKVVWEGENDFARQFGAKLRLYLTEWKNPKPDKEVVSIDYEREGASVAGPFCVAMTAAEE